MPILTYPISVPRISYRGKDPTKRMRTDSLNHTAHALEEYLNKNILAQTSEISIYNFSIIALETGVDLNTVRNLLSAIDGGSNGLTVSKPLTQDK